MRWPSSRRMSSWHAPRSAGQRARASRRAARRSLPRAPGRRVGTRLARARQPGTASPGRSSRRCLRGSVADTLLSAAMQVHEVRLPHCRDGVSRSSQCSKRSPTRKCCDAPRLGWKQARSSGLLARARPDCRGKRGREGGTSQRPMTAFPSTVVLRIGAWGNSMTVELAAGFLEVDRFGGNPSVLDLVLRYSRCQGVSQPKVRVLPVSLATLCSRAANPTSKPVAFCLAVMSVKMFMSPTWATQ
jgi:hypothetical protein